MYQIKNFQNSKIHSTMLFSMMDKWCYYFIPICSIFRETGKYSWNIFTYELI